MSYRSKDTLTANVASPEAHYVPSQLNLLCGLLTSLVPQPVVSSWVHLATPKQMFGCRAKSEEGVLPGLEAGIPGGFRSISALSFSRISISRSSRSRSSRSRWSRSRLSRSNSNSNLKTKSHGLKCCKAAFILPSDGFWFIFMSYYSVIALSFTCVSTIISLIFLDLVLYCNITFVMSIVSSVSQKKLH